MFKLIWCHYHKAFVFHLIMTSISLNSSTEFPCGYLQRKNFLFIFVFAPLLDSTSNLSIKADIIIFKTIFIIRQLSILFRDTFPWLPPYKF